jgi:hypothetical protein
MSGGNGIGGNIELRTVIRNEYIRTIRIKQFFIPDDDPDTKEEEKCFSPRARYKLMSDEWRTFFRCKGENQEVADK